MSYEALFEQADRALYEAKNKNRNNIQVFGGGGYNALGGVLSKPFWLEQAEAEDNEEE